METDQNPADDASCGQNAQNLIENLRWWNGPEFLRKPLEDQSSPDGAEPMCISPDDPEVKTISVMTTQTQGCFSLPGRLKYFSSWHRAKRAVAVCLRLQKKYRTSSEGQDMVKTEQSKQKKMDQYIPVNTEEFQEAETDIVKGIQREEFDDEIRLLRFNNSQQGSGDRTSTRVMQKNSNLYTLDPFLDENGVLRVGGHLKHADLSTAVKYPAILPRKGHMTDLIISHCHDSVEHQGREMTQQNQIL